MTLSQTIVNKGRRAWGDLMQRRGGDGEHFDGLADEFAQYPTIGEVLLVDALLDGHQHPTGTGDFVDDLIGGEALEAGDDAPSFEHGEIHTPEETEAAVDVSQAKSRHQAQSARGCDFGQLEEQMQNMNVLRWRYRLRVAKLSREIDILIGRFATLLQEGLPDGKLPSL